MKYEIKLLIINDLRFKTYNLIPVITYIICHIFFTNIKFFFVLGKTTIRLLANILHKNIRIHN
jgi:hypothetical protein